MRTCGICRNAKQHVDRDAYAVRPYTSKKPSSETNLRGGRSVVHLLEPVVAVIVTPIDEDGSVINARAMLAPALKAYVSRRKGSDGRPLPSEIALGPVGAEDHGRASVTIPIAPGLVLSCIPYIEDADGPHEIELWPADIDVRAVLNEPQGEVGGNEIIYWQGLKRSTVVGPEQGFNYAVSVV